jgi:hypothetical protein
MKVAIDTHTPQDELVARLKRLVADLQDQSKVGGIVSSLDGKITYVRSER